jgi:uncharacterized protein (TIGR04255 family)
MLRRVDAVFGEVKVKRAGLRYLNRIALPKHADVAEWLRLGMTAPELLAEPFAFNLRETWERIQGFDGLSATLGLARIHIEDALLATDHDGVLLDIEVFNLLIAHAPSFRQVPDWFVRAHDAENRVFEGCMTDALRNSFT